MSTETLELELREEEKGFEAFTDIPQAVVWIEDAAEKLGQRTALLEGYLEYGERHYFAQHYLDSVSDRYGLNLQYGLTKEEMSPTANLLKEHGVIIESRINSSLPELSKPKDESKETTMLIEDYSGGAYDLSFIRKFTFGPRHDALNTTISYTTGASTELEHTSNASIDINPENGNKRVKPEVEEEFLRLANGIRSAILWKVQALDPSVMDELEIGPGKPASKARKILGRIAGGNAVKIKSK